MTPRTLVVNRIVSWWWCY